ncbi:MAG: hypothetical protein AAF824_08085 [Bacteroidota bacterium]
MTQAVKTVTHPDREISKGKWVLKLYYVSKGETNEGVNGELFLDNKPVMPKHVGEVVPTDLGEMKYYCDPGERKMPFEFTGWLYADSNAISMSWE